MRIEIEHKSPRKVEAVLRAVMEANGGAWIANACGGEGFVLAKAGTEAGSRLQRSGAAGLCGPFTIDLHPMKIAIALRTAKTANKAAYGADEEDAEDEFIPAEEAIFTTLLDGRLASVTELIEQTGRTPSAVKKAVCQMKKDGLLTSARPSKAGKNPVCAIYRLAA